MFGRDAGDRQVPSRVSRRIAREAEVYYDAARMTRAQIQEHAAENESAQKAERDAADSCGIFGIRRRAVRKYGAGTWQRRCCWKFRWCWGGPMTANRSPCATLVRIAEYLSRMDGLTARTWSAVITDGSSMGRSGQCVEIPSLTSQDKLKVERIFAGHYPCVENDGYVWVFMAGRSQTQ